MEVIVDDTQLSLAIGKKGQNVRLAAKLLGWKIDIKSEEEKRQEVETAMAALVPAGAPISVLLDHGLAEEIVEKLLEAGVGTVEQLGSMTPEELESIPSIGSGIVEKILIAVNGYYAQFEQSDVVEETVPGLAEATGDFVEESASEPALEAESGLASTESETAETDHVPGGNTSDEKKEFDTIENSEGVR
jgi:N utilization substance protein A